MRAKNLRTPALGVEMLSTQKAADTTLDAYAKAHAVGEEAKAGKFRGYSIGGRANLLNVRMEDES